MRTLFSALALAGTALAATPVLAQEEAPFTGPHVEVLGGYDNVDGDDAFAYGIGAGFDFQAGKAIIGIEGEYMDSTAKEGTANAALAGDFLRVKAKRDLYVGGRLGFEVSPGTLLYGKAGYTNAQAGFRYTTPTGVTTSRKNTFDGYRVGAGIEKKFSLFGPSGFIKAEYRFSNYGNQNFPGPDLDVDFDRHQGIVGLGVRF
jgi:outer membrane immunogenic protein